jgi:hypothetical protein
MRQVVDLIDHSVLGLEITTKFPQVNYDLHLLLPRMSPCRTSEQYYTRVEVSRVFRHWKLIYPSRNFPIHQPRHYHVDKDGH